MGRAQLQAQRFAYLDKLYRRWAPNWSGPERDACLREIKPEIVSFAAAL